MGNPFRKIGAFVDENRHMFILLYFIVYLAWFTLIEKHITANFHIIHTPIDDLIPFCEYFVVPYVLWFAYIAWGILYFGFRNVDEFFKLCMFLFTGMTLFLVISTVYPNGHYLRPTYFTHHNVFTQLCSIIYKSDTATNLFPSIHCYNSLGVHFAVMTSREFRHNKVGRFISLILCISIILATMFIKQHSCFDVITGIMLAAIMYHLVYVQDIFRRKQKTPGKLAHGTLKKK